MNKSRLYSFTDGIEIAAGEKTCDVILEDNPLRHRTAKFPICSTSRIAAREPFI